VKKTLNYGPGNGWTAESRLHDNNIGPLMKKLLEIEHKYDIGLKIVTILVFVWLCLAFCIIVR